MLNTGCFENVSCKPRLIFFNLSGPGMMTIAIMMMIINQKFKIKLLELRLKPQELTH